MDVGVGRPERISPAFRAAPPRTIAASELSSLHAGRADWQSGESGNGGSREAAAILFAVTVVQHHAPDVVGAYFFLEPWSLFFASRSIR